MQRPQRDPGSSDAFIVSPLRNKGMSTRKLLTLVSLALLLVVTLGAAGYLLKSLPDARPSARVPATASRPLPTYTPQPTSTPVPLPQGWRQPFAGQAQSIAFAPNEPLTGYACALTAESNALNITLDGGKTWRQTNGPNPQLDLTNNTGICTIAVNPYDPQDVVVENALCSGRYCGPTGLIWKLARSFDGGKSWRLFAPPPTNGVASAFANFLAWTSDGGLYVAGVTKDGVQTNAIAMSDHGGAFTWITGQPVSENPQLPNAPISALYALGTQLYAEVDSVTGVPGLDPFPHGSMSVSYDHGAHWATPQAYVGVGALNFENIAPDGGAVVAYHNGTLQRSDDGGSTWQSAPPLPLAPQLILNPSFVIATPDGGFIAEFIPNNGPDTATPITLPAQIYIAHPGATSWRHVLDLVDPHDYWQIIPATVTVDAQGHPTSLWAISAVAPATPEHDAIVYAIP